MNSIILLQADATSSDIVLTMRTLEKSRMAGELEGAADGQHTLEYLFGTGASASRDFSQTPAGVLLEPKLQMVDGTEALRRIRSHPCKRGQPMVVLTSSAEKQDLAASYDSEMNCFFHKPVDVDQCGLAIWHWEWYWLAINEASPKVRPA
jgi:two-component system, response regulator